MSGATRNLGMGGTTPPQIPPYGRNDIRHFYSLHNPTVKSERQIMQSVDEAHRDAQLQDSVRSRRYGRELLQVILTSNIHVRFEPIVDLKSARVLGYEALTRGPAGSDLASPQQLFQQAEKSGLLFDLDCLCRSVALESARLLPRNKVVFLNCLPTAIGDPNLRDEGLRKTLENYNLQPSDMVLEISESESIENFGVFREVSDACRELGIRIAIDDAGTGYAGLEAIMEIAPVGAEMDIDAAAVDIDDRCRRRETVLGIRRAGLVDPEHLRIEVLQTGLDVVGEEAERPGALSGRRGEPDTAVRHDR